MQVLSPYILKKKSETGELFFNSKNNHSFFITNDLQDVDEDGNEF
ncbi:MULTISPECIES: hypothetical protein [Streptococcus]|nr:MULTISPECIES: hypothetical protein [Streptococcus]CKJ53428.1 transcriptional regulator [Streptococcus pneumoniae]